MNKICVFGDELCFNSDTELEKYRVESIFEKEPETIAWINDWASASEDNAAVFFDIGANIGIYSLYAAYKAKNAEVFAFEPVSNNYVALQSNLWLNSMGNVIPLNIALSKNGKLTTLYLSDLRVGNSGAQIDSPVNEKGEEYKPQRIEKVLSVAVDQLVSSFAFPVPNYVKIDVDGHETDILNGMHSVLRNEKLKSVLIEFNNVDEFNYWEKAFLDSGLIVDHSYDDVPNHSGIRRQKNGALARNYIFTRM
jgi:FkbM family methyltransferase